MQPESTRVIVCGGSGIIIIFRCARELRYKSADLRDLSSMNSSGTIETFIFQHQSEFDQSTLSLSRKLYPRYLGRLQNKSIILRDNFLMPHRPPGCNDHCCWSNGAFVTNLDSELSPLENVLLRTVRRSTFCAKRYLNDAASQIGLFKFERWVETSAWISESMVTFTFGYELYLHNSKSAGSFGL